MKNLNRFYVFYGIVLAISIVITFLDLFPYPSSIGNLFKGITFFGLLGMIPVGALQVVLAVVTFLQTRDKQWMFYFIPFLIWIIYVVIIRLLDLIIDESSLAFSPFYISPVICYITYIVLMDRSLKRKAQSSKR